MRKMTETERVGFIALLTIIASFAMIVAALCLSRTVFAADLLYPTTGTTKQHGLIFAAYGGATRFRVWTRDAFAPAGSPWQQGADYTYLSANCRFRASWQRTGGDLCQVPVLLPRASVFKVWHGRPDPTKPGGIDWFARSEEQNRLLCTLAANGDTLCVVNTKL